MFVITVHPYLVSNLSIALRRLTALLTNLVWLQGRKVEEGWLWAQVLLPGFRHISGCLKKSRLISSEVRLISLLVLREEMAYCPQYSRQSRARIRNSLRRSRVRVGQERYRALAKVVLEVRRKVLL